jgi:hypothetical protein
MAKTAARTRKAAKTRRRSARPAGASTGKKVVSLKGVHASLGKVIKELEKLEPTWRNKFEITRLRFLQKNLCGKNMLIELKPILA